MKPVTIPFDFYIACTFKDLNLYLERATRIFYNQHQAEIAKKISKAKQHPEAELLTNLSKKVCLYRWCYIINCKENDNGNDKIDHINKIYKDQDADIETNMQNIVCLCKTLPLCNLLKI